MVLGFKELNSETNLILFGNFILINRYTFLQSGTPVRLTFGFAKEPITFNYPKKLVLI